MAWALERLCRHPELLSRLTEEVDAGGSELRQATIWEVQRTRPVLDSRDAAHKDANPVGRLGNSGEHQLDDQYPSWPMTPKRASPTRPRSTRTDSSAARRSPLAGSRSAAASTVVSARRSPTWRWTSPCAHCCANFGSCQPMRRTNGGRWRGVATVPARGARAVVYRRTAEASSDADSASVADHGSA